MIHSTRAPVAKPPYDVVGRLECTRDGRCFGYGFFGITVDEGRGRLYATKRDNDYCGIWTLTPTADGRVGPGGNERGAPQLPSSTIPATAGFTWPLA